MGLASSWPWFSPESKRNPNPGFPKEWWEGVSDGGIIISVVPIQLLHVAGSKVRDSQPVQLVLGL